MSTIRLTISRRQLLAGLAGGAAIGLAGSATAGPQGLTYVTPYHYDVTFYETLIAQTAGLFEKEAVRVTIEPGQNAVQGIQQVLAGRAALTRTVGINMIRAIAMRDAPLVSIATLVPGPFFNVYSHLDDPVQSPADLAGRTVGVVAHRAATDVSLDLMLIEAGVDPASIKREIAPDIASTFALLDAGKIDAWIGGPTTFHRMRAAGMRVARMPIRNGIPSQIVVTTKKLLEERGEDLSRYLRAIGAATELVERMAPKEVLQHLSRFDLPALADPAIALADLDMARAFLMGPARARFANDPAQWESAARRLADAGIIPPVDPSRLYSNALIDMG